MKNKNVLKISMFIVLIISSIVSFALVIFIIRKTDFFTVKKINFIGDLKEEHFLQAHAVTDNLIGRRLLSINFNLINKKLSELFWVENLYIRWKFPDMLNINIKVRSPVAFVHTYTENGFKIFQLDSKGLILEEGFSLSYLEAPLITGLEIKNPLLGRVVEMKELLSLLKILSCLKDKKPFLYSNLQEIKMENSLGFIRYRIIFSDKNIMIRTDKITMNFFEGLEVLLSYYPSIEDIEFINVLSNMFFVEEKNQSNIRG